MTPALFKPKRVCCVCQAEASYGSKKPVAGEPVIVAISPVVYRRGASKGQLRNAPRVQVCEACLTKALTTGRLGWLSGDGGKLWNALRSSLLDCYGIMVENDNLSQVNRPDWRNPEATLL